MLSNAQSTDLHATVSTVAIFGVPSVQPRTNRDRQVPKTAQMMIDTYQTMLSSAPQNLITNNLETRLLFRNEVAKYS